MVIKGFGSDMGREYATVILSYEDVRNTVNGMYLCSKEARDAAPEDKDIAELRKECQNTYAQWALLFDMVKHGMIQPDTVKILDQSVEEAELL